jgi:hypothetical protein
MKVVLLVDSTSPVWPWVMSLLRASAIRERAQEQMRQTRRLDVHVLGLAETLAWGQMAARSRGPN